MCKKYISSSSDLLSNKLLLGGQSYVDQITSPEREWFINLQLTDKLWFITKKNHARADLFRFKHIENDDKVIVVFRFF